VICIKLTETVTPSQDEGWFRGYTNHKTGLVPGNYLEFIKDEPVDITPKYAQSRRAADQQQQNMSQPRDVSPPRQPQSYEPDNRNNTESKSKFNKHSVRMSAKDRSGEYAVT
jgi:hypothetical protein